MLQLCSWWKWKPQDPNSCCSDSANSYFKKISASENFWVLPMFGEKSQCPPHGDIQREKTFVGSPRSSLHAQRVSHRHCSVCGCAICHRFCRYIHVFSRRGSSFCLVVSSLHAERTSFQSTLTELTTCDLLSYCYRFCRELCKVVHMLLRSDLGEIRHCCHLHKIQQNSIAKLCIKK